MRQPNRAPEAPAEESPASADQRGKDAELPAQLADLGVSPAREEATHAQLPTAAPVFGALGIARISSLDVENRRVQVSTSAGPMDASVDPSVHFSVLRTADERGEPVLVEQRGKEICVVGALRTQPTPGVDKMSNITFEADRIEMKAKQEIAMSSGVAAIAVRAIGEVETYAERIVSRAESVHKIIGRMLRLN